MKKIISVLLAVMLIVSVSCISGNAQGAAPSFEVVGGSARVGDTVDVNIKVNNNPGITSLQLKVAYSDKDLELIGIEDKELLGNPVSRSDLSRNPLIISWFSSNSVNSSSSGVLVTLRFRVKDNAKSSNITLSYDPDDVFNIDFQNIEFQVTNGSVDIVTDSPTLSVSTESGCVNDTVEAKVLIEKNPSITALRINVAYSSNDLELLEIRNGGVFDEAISHSQTLSSPITISWYSQQSVNCDNNGVLAILRFRIRENAQSSQISLSYDEDDIFNSSFDNIYFSVQNGAVNISEKTYLLGDVNGDNKVDISDVTSIQRHIAKIENLEGGYFIAADTNCDGSVNIIDATTTQKYIAQYDVPYPIGEPILLS